MVSDNNPERGSSSRRRFIQVTSGATAVALAGCTGGGGGGGGESTDESMDNGTDSGSSESSGDTNNRAGGTLSIAQAKSPPDFDPVLQLGGPAAIIGERFFSNITTFDDGTNVIPGDIATGMPEVERGGERYIVEIVDDATFHNGDPVTAEDVAYTYQAPIDEETRMAGSYGMVNNIETVDDTTVQFDLDYQYGAFPGALAGMGVVPKSVREEDKEAFGLNPVGSGPFQLTEYTENELTRLEKWDDYWGDLDPHLDAVEYTPVVEPTTRVTNFRQGDAHMMQSIPPQLISTVEQLDGGAVQSQPALGYRFITFNLNAGETTKPKVREALDYCVDLQSVVDRFVAPVGVRQYQPLPNPQAESWDMPIDRWEDMAVGKDTEEASRLFEEADVPDDWECLMLCPPDDLREQMLVSMANGVKDAGYQATVQRLDWGTYLEKFTSGDPDDYNLYALGWSVNADPDYHMHDMFHESTAGTNQGHYWSDDEAMEMIMQARKSTDREERRELYIQLQDKILEQRVQLPAWNTVETWGVRDAVQDFSLHPIPVENPRLVTDYQNVWLDQ